jgi:hypothetical protein
MRQLGRWLSGVSPSVEARCAVKLYVLCGAALGKNHRSSGVHDAQLKKTVDPGNIFVILKLDGLHNRLLQ